MTGPGRSWESYPTPQTSPTPRAHAYNYTPGRAIEHEPRTLNFSTPWPRAVHIVVVSRAKGMPTSSSIEIPLRDTDEVGVYV